MNRPAKAKSKQRPRRRRVLQKLVGYATNIATLPGALPPWLADPIAEGIAGQGGVAAMHAMRGLRQVRNNVKSYYERKPAWQVQYRQGGEYALRQQLRDKYDTRFPRTNEPMRPRPGQYPDDMAREQYGQLYDPGRRRAMSDAGYPESFYGEPPEGSMHSAASYFGDDLGDPDYFVDPEYMPITRVPKRRGGPHAHAYPPAAKRISGTETRGRQTKRKRTSSITGRVRQKHTHIKPLSDFIQGRFEFNPGV